MSKSAFELAEELALKRMADEDAKKDRARAEQRDWENYVNALLLPISDAVRAANDKYLSVIHPWSAFLGRGIGFDVAVDASRLIVQKPVRLEVRDRSGKAYLYYNDSFRKEGEVADLLPEVIDIIATALASRRAVKKEGT